MAAKKNQPDITDSALRKILKEVKNSIREAIGDSFRLILFGSYATGRAQPDSDVDLLMVLPDELYTFEVEEKACDAVYDFILKTDYLLSVIVVSESLMEERKGFMFFDSVEKEGITL